jgi:MFS family permease
LSTGVTAALVLAAGLTGLAGLLVGRWSADRFGRRPTAAVGLVSVALAGMVTYSGSVPAAAAGYLVAVMAGSVFAPAAGAMHAELFPTAIRATVAGWTVAAG